MTTLVIAKAQAVLSEPELLRAMFDVGYFTPNTPRDILMGPNKIGTGRCWRRSPRLSSIT
jgi:hypothetical protein